MRPETFAILLGRLQQLPNAAAKLSGNPELSLEKQLMIAIWYLANIESFRSVADRFGISKSTAWSSVYKICNLLLEANIVYEIISFPNNDRCVETINNIEGKTGFPGYLISDDDVESRNDEDDNLRACECRGAVCMCCVDFNLTYIDLGGPGCVEMKYISQEEGLKLNVSYGVSLLHSQQVKGPNPDATCMALLTNLAEICARFSNLLPHNDGLRGCLLLEPKLLKAVTATFRIGCFTMGPEGMTLEDRNVTVPDIEIIGNETISAQNQNETQNINEDLLTVVNETAEKGLAILGNLLDFAFGESSETETSTENSETTNKDALPATGISTASSSSQ